MIQTDELRFTYMAIYIHPHAHTAVLHSRHYTSLKVQVHLSNTVKTKSTSAPSVYCFNHIHLDTATINKLPWERYTACIQAQTSLLSVFFWYNTLKQPFFLPTFGCVLNLHPEENVHTTLLHEQTFLAGFCFSYI